MTGAEAIKMIRDCFEADRCRPLRHFQDRMRQRGLTWPDILSVLDQPDQITMDGYDDYGRERCLVSGHADDGLAIKIICALSVEVSVTVLVTVHFED